MNQLELDDLEVLYLLEHFCVVSHHCFHFEITCANISYILQMDEEERYNRKLESGLYTLQVRICCDLLFIAQVVGKHFAVATDPYYQIDLILSTSGIVTFE